ncbi:hypothetical protein DMB42_13950 [Nonomuraea sp. WAC 01424]|uniref:hypothetical protein n=1 Tax=Nonomuraea sp. WAC 01424 TaxID=2203200 RepID=UPI000F7B05B0|nr:hypothetical protein [Nonomuraea sp. WAC 01424]RSN11671.1 hypothetical protein DMB42_13950 [Nonomuraea sp. WAC 01424]
MPSTSVAGAAVPAPAAAAAAGARVVRAAADPTCGSWVSSLVFPGLSARACVWGTGANLQNGQTALCATQVVPDNNPFQFHRAVGSTEVSVPGRREQFAFSSPFVG